MFFDNEKKEMTLREGEYIFVGAVNNPRKIKIVNLDGILVQED